MNKISDLFDKINFDKKFVIELVNRVNSSIEISSMLNISIFEANRLINYIHKIQNDNQIKTSKYFFSNQYDFIKKKG